MLNRKLSNRLIIWTLVSYLFIPFGAGHGGAFMGMLVLFMFQKVLNLYTPDTFTLAGLSVSITTILLLLAIFIKNTVLRDVMYFSAVVIATISIFILAFGDIPVQFSFVFASPFFVLVALRIAAMVRGKRTNSPC